MASYKKYLHVERLGTEECEGLLENEAVYVTAKVDGSNGCVFWDETSGEVRAGSRNFVLSDDEDNAYFHEWLKSGAEEACLLRAYCEQNPERVVYGEWMGRDKFVGAFKAYDKAAKGTLIIFDVFDEESGEFVPEEQWRTELAEAGLGPHFVKLLAVLDHPSEADVLAIAEGNDFLLEGTGMVGEGVVCKVPGWKNKFGRTAYGKIVLEEFKKQRKSAVESVAVEPDIVAAFVTDAEIEKTMAKVCTMAGADAFDAGSRKMMGMLSSFCWKDLLSECPNWVKKFKNPKVDFGVLSGLCAKRVKEFVEAM
ncbi:MAG: RNA ligase family protein [Eggerthellaceae bacterium]|nr:RNA ligase family protein [Eggerthellaceae bacterium]